MSAFDKVIGYEAEKQELLQICDMLRNRERYEALGAMMPRGLLIHGAPGLGKSLMARCLMEELGWNSFVVRRNRPDGDFVRELGRVFQKAVEKAPAVILLDDMDKFVAVEDSQEEYVAVQAGIDEVAGKNVYIIATANNLRDIPKSLLRSGRFDRKMEITVPKGKDAEEIIQFYLGQKRLGDTICSSDVAKMLFCKSCAELESVLNEAAIYAGYECSEKVEMRHIVEAVLRCEYGVFNREERADTTMCRRIAYHESGHAVMQDLLCEGGVGFVSIRPRKSKVGGFMRSCAEPGLDCGDILVPLAGPAAEEVQYGAWAAGSSNDIKRTADGLQADVENLGAHGLGLLSIGHSDSESIIARREAVTAAELTRYLAAARTILAQNKTYLDAMAAALLEKGTLLNSDLRQIRSQVSVVTPDRTLWGI